MQESFDKSAVFNAEIRPLLRRLFDLCVEHEIPLVCLAVSATQEQEDHFSYDCAHLIHGHVKYMPPLMKAMIGLAELPAEQQEQVQTAINVMLAVANAMDNDNAARFN